MENNEWEFNISNKRKNANNEWYCVTSPNNEARYILGVGEITKDTIIVIGVNPSVASEEKEDPTMIRVKNKLDKLKNNSFVMLNIFPLRKTKPSELPKTKDLDEKDRYIHSENLKAISFVLDKIKEDILKNKINKEIEVWCAWGSTIDDRKYLKDFLKDIYDKFNEYNINWCHIGPLSKNGNPHHPLYLSDKYPFETFKIEEYIK